MMVYLGGHQMAGRGRERAYAVVWSRQPAGRLRSGREAGDGRGGQSAGPLWHFVDPTIR
jgi:hypothetical protein